jgi:hypothetical protein
MNIMEIIIAVMLAIRCLPLLDAYRVEIFNRCRRSPAQES